MHYNHFRYYDPELGRYITSDPIGIIGGMNTYGYVEQNPIMYYDPDGLVALNSATGAGTGLLVCGPACAAIGGILGGIALYYAGEAIVDAIDDSAEAIPDFPSDYGEDECGKWECTGYGQYELIGANKTVVRGGYFVVYGKTEPIAALNWKKKVQAAAPRGYTARHIRPRCKKVQ